MIRLALLTIVLFAVIGCVTCEGGTEMSIQDKYEQMLHTSVHIQTNKGSGSGVVIDEFGGFTIILTARHVVSKTKKVWVRFYESEWDYAATVLKTSKEHDLALLMVHHKHDYKANWGDPLELYVFEEIYKVGHAMGEEDPLVTEGIISAVNADEMYFTMSSPVIFGDSGGGVFWFDGEDYILIGITAALKVLPMPYGKVPVYHIGYAIDMVAAHELFKQEE